MQSAISPRSLGRPCGNGLGNQHSKLGFNTTHSVFTGVKSTRRLAQIPVAQSLSNWSRDLLYNPFKFLAVSFGGLAAISVAVSAFTVVPAGEIAVTDTFGKVDKAPLASGPHFKSPFADVKLFSLKTKLLDATQDVPTSEGLVVHLDASILHHTDPNKVKELYLTVGRNYEQVLIQPELQSSLRNLTSEVSAKALYSSGRTALSDKLLAEMNEKLNPRGIIVEQVMLRSIVLPRQVTAAIEQKLSAEQESQRMEFVLLKEQQEAERKRIEATGIQEFQSIVSKGISRPLLEWKGIEATEKLAMSNNAKVVVIGNKDGLPLIFNSDDKNQ